MKVYFTPAQKRALTRLRDGVAVIDEGEVTPAVRGQRRTVWQLRRKGYCAFNGATWELTELGRRAAEQLG